GPPPSNTSLDSDPASVLALILPYVEQDNVYHLFDFTKGMRNSSVNYFARIQQVKFYLCPSERSSATLQQQGQAPAGQPVAVPDGRDNYVACLGTTADPRGRVNGNAGADLGDITHVGVFNYTTSGNTRIGIRITDIRDGTSNTAMWSETTLAAAQPNGVYDPTNIYLLPNTDAGWSAYTPQTGPLFNETNANAMFVGNTYRC